MIVRSGPSRSGGWIIRCGICGLEIEEHVTSCPHCGQDVVALSARPSVPEPHEHALRRKFSRERRVTYLRMGVVAIVACGLLAVLAFTLMPLVTHSGLDARMAECRMHQAKIGSAIISYSLDSGHWPGGLGDLAVYLDEIGTCPSGTRPYTWVPGTADVPPRVSCPNEKDHNL